MELPSKFTGHQYLNIETFRKNGAGVKTPVWFVAGDGVLYIRTVANCGKVKRIRNNSGVNIAPCKVDGELLGDWMPASAQEAGGEEVARKVDRMLGKKYGLMKTFFAIAAAFKRQKFTVIEVRPGEEVSAPRP